MDKEEFIEKMKQYNYTDEEIEEFVSIVEEDKANGIMINYEDLILEKVEKCNTQN